MDDAPQFQRTDMGTADWAIETKIHLSSYSGDTFHAGLMVYFGQYDLYYWGFKGGTNLQLDRSGVPIILTAANTSRVVYLRIQKSGSIYTFSYRTPGTFTWTTVGTDTMASTVQKVGLVAKTWDQPVSLTLNVDYFDLCKVDNFSGSTLNSAWTQYIPVSGPSFTVGSEKLRISIPDNTWAYDHWTTVDDAPQLRRSDMVSNDWAIETKATAVTTTGAFHTGLLVRFGQYDLFYWGFDVGTNLQLDRSGQMGLIKVPYGSTVAYLRIEKVGSTYNFFYKAAEDDPWIFAGARTPVTDTVTHVGLITKTWESHTAVTTDYDYFKLQPRVGS